jgi:TetR/AcrR family transcriptional regulator
MPIKAFDKLPEDERSRILAACLSEFADRGYAQASTNTIVKRLGIAKGSIFYWFGSKDALYMRLVDGAVESFMDALKETMHQWPDEILRRLRSITEASLGFLQQHPDGYRLFTAFMEGDARHLRDAYLKERMPAGLAVWANWFAGVDASDFRATPEEVQRLLMWVMAGIKVEMFALVGREGSTSDLRKQFMTRLDSVIGLLGHAIYRHPARWGYG